MKKLLLLTLATGCTLLFCKAQLAFDHYKDFDSKFDNAGRFHNSHLTNVMNNFPEGLNLDYKSAAEAVKNFNQKYYLDNVEKFCTVLLPVQSVNEAFESTKLYVDKKLFTTLLLDDKNEGSLNNVVKQLTSTGLFDYKNSDLLKAVNQNIKKNIQGEIDNLTFEKSLLVCGNEWLKINGDKPNSSGGAFTGSLISIALNSCQWWRQNPAANYDTKMLFLSSVSPVVEGESYKNVLNPIVGLDAAGALVAGGVSIGLQWSRNRSVNWGNAGQSAVMGAVGASTGIVGKVGKFFGSLF